MAKQILAKTFLVSPSEIIRLMYAWCMKFFLTVGNIIGWTITLSIALTYFSIKVLPFVLLVNALFSIVGMLLFSVLISYVDSRKLIIGSGILAILSIMAASFFYESKVLLLVFVLLASGMFLAQISILLANYLEDFFTPREAERIFPKIDSAETIGGILAGLMLVVLGFAFMSFKLLWLWAIFTAAFLFIFITIKPEVPSELEQIEKSSEKFRKKIRFNGLVLGLQEVRRTPFLQLLLYVSVINWIIAQLVEFEFAKAVNDSIANHGSLLEHEIALTYGLGALQILFHSSALAVELLATSRLLKLVGTLGGFMIHAVLTFISGLAVLLSFNYLTAVLLRNNFEISSIIHRTSYETSYYAFRYGTQKPIREIFEGLFMPLGVIIGTLILILVELFFVEEHFIYPINFVLMFLVIAMVFVTFQLRDKYAGMVKKNLDSKIPLEKYHAIEVSGQMKHEDALKNLMDSYFKTDDVEIKIATLDSIVSKGQAEVIEFLVDVIKSEKGDIAIKALELLEEKISSGGIRELSPAIKKKAADLMIEKVGSANSYERYLAGRVVVFLDSRRAEKNAKDDLIEFLIADSENRGEMKEKLVRRMMRRGEVEMLAEIARNYSHKTLREFFRKMLKSRKNEVRLNANYGLLNMRKCSNLKQFINLLLFGDNVIFKKALEKLKNLSERNKIMIRGSLQRRYGSSPSSIPKTHEGKKVIRRIKEVYSLTDL